MHQEYTSLWRKWPAPLSFTRLQGNVRAEIAIVGGGLAGLLTAYWLQKEGIHDVVLLEAAHLGSGTSASSTGKITALHTLLYSETLNKLPDDQGRIVADVLSRSVEQYAELIDAERIECNFARLPAVEFSSDPLHKEVLKREFEAASRLGLRVRFSEKPLELPVPSTAALSLENQAQFHPYKFLIGLAQTLQQRGLRIYEQTPVQEIRDGKLITPEGNVIATRVVIATRFPIVDPHGGFFAKMIQEREYFLASRNVPKLSAMYLDIATHGFSWRSYETEKEAGKENLLLLGGFVHKTGHEGHELHFPRLKEALRQLYPEAEIVAQWSAQDCVSFDKLPYFGPLQGHDHRFLVLTGFTKWGISSSMAGASLLAQALVHGHATELEPFLPQRFQLESQLSGMAASFADVAAGLTTRILPAISELSDLLPGHGGIVRHRGQTLGVYRELKGTLHAIVPVCSHLGCALQWNADDRSWDCPCHGSRFDPDGKPIGTPGYKPLERVTLE